MLRNSRQGRRAENIWPSAAANWWRARRLRAPPRDAAILADACVNAAGRLVLVDSLKRGDRPDYEGFLALFPQNYHEPY